MSKPAPAPGSFRDKAGSVFLEKGRALRTISESFGPRWQAVLDSGFFKSAAAKESVIAFSEAAPLPGAWKTLESPLIPFISYPYEWCFSQLKQAALLTLDIMECALAHGLILRDASAYNIQFTGPRPIFIDLLSLAPRDKAKPWEAYGQFCGFFLAPLALMSLRSPVCGRFLRDFIEGLPLDLTSALLPFSSRLSPLLALHIHKHAKLQKRYEDPRKGASALKTMRFSEKIVPNLVKSLRMAIEGLKPPAEAGEWGDYYSDTNYSAEAAQAKLDLVQKLAGKYAPKKDNALDLGANTAVYSRFLTERFKSVVAVDIDYSAIEQSFQHARRNSLANLLPLVQDLCNPSPGLGWNGRERLSFQERCEADYLSALALVHHLAFTGGIPLTQIAAGFAALMKPGGGGILLLEWVPEEDSQVRRLLAARKYAPFSWNREDCLKAFSQFFELLESCPVTGSIRELLAFRKK